MNKEIVIKISSKIDEKISPAIKEIGEVAKSTNNAVNALKKGLDALGLGKAFTQITKAMNESIKLNEKAVLSKEKIAQAEAKTLNAEEKVYQQIIKTTDAQNKSIGTIERAKKEKESLSVATEKAVTVNLELKDSIDKAGVSMEKNSIQLEKNKEKTISFNKKIMGIIHSFNNFGKAIFSAVRNVKFLFLLMGGRELIRLSDDFINLSNRLKIVANGTENLTYLQGKLFDISMKARVPIADLAISYQRYDMALSRLGYTQKESLRFTETMSKQLTIAGVSTMEASQGLRQLSQALNKGKLDGDEFRTIMETLPLVADAIAKEMGVARGELLKLAPQGAITARVIGRAMLAVSEETDKAFGSIQMTVSQAFINMKNAMTEMFGEMNSQIGITTILAKSINAVAISVRALKVALEGLIPLLTSGGALFLIWKVRTIGLVASFEALKMGFKSGLKYLSPLLLKVKEFLKPILNLKAGALALGAVIISTLHLLAKNLNLSIVNGDTFYTRMKAVFHGFSFSIKSLEPVFDWLVKAWDNTIGYLADGARFWLDLISSGAIKIRGIIDRDGGKKVREELKKAREEAMREAKADNARRAEGYLDDMKKEIDSLSHEAFFANLNTQLEDAKTKSKELRVNLVDAVKVMQDSKRIEVLGESKLFSSGTFSSLKEIEDKHKSIKELEEEHIRLTERYYTYTKNLGDLRRNGNIEYQEWSDIVVRLYVNLKKIRAEMTQEVFAPTSLNIIRNLNADAKEYLTVMKELNTLKEKGAEYTDEEVRALMSKLQIEQSLLAIKNSYESRQTSINSGKNIGLLGEYQTILTNTRKMKEDLDKDNVDLDSKRNALIKGGKGSGDSESKIAEITKQMQALTAQRNEIDRASETQLESLNIRRLDSIYNTNMAEYDELERAKEAELELSRQYWATKSADLENQKLEELAIEKKYAELRAKIKTPEEIEKEKKKQKMIEELQETSNFLGSMSDLFAQFNEDDKKRNKEAFYAQQAFALASATLSVSVGMAKALEKGMPAGAIEAASIATLGGMQIGQILATTLAYKDGGLVQGKGGSRDDAIMARLSNGEFVMNADSTRKYRPQLEAMNNDSYSNSNGGKAVMVNVYNESGVEVETQTSESEDQTNIDIFLRKVDQSLAKNFRENTGALTGVINSRMKRGF